MFRTCAGLMLCSMALLGCRPPMLVEAGADWRLEPASLEFPATVVGQERRSSVKLTNASRVNGAMLLEVAAPFSAPPRLEVPAGESVTFDVFFLPREAGVATQTVQLRSSTQTLALELSARGSAPVSCPATTAPCRLMQQTPEGLCIEVAVTDGLACSTPCIENGTCSQGQCAGQARGCDDRDACTTDACDETTGCTHLPVACTAPSNPCQAAQCNAASGCSAVEVADGTPCGANTCVTAKVCVAGQCREVPSPEGSSCAPATSCRGAGSCQQGACLVPPATTLSPAWTYRAPTGSTLSFPGVGDHAGNVYWLESAGGTVQLVSVDFDGVERFRVRMAGAPNPGASWPSASSPLMLVSDTQLVVLLRDQSPANGPGHRIESRSAVDGSLLWSRSRADFVAPLALAPGLPLWVTSAGVLGAGRVFLTLRSNAGGSAWSSWLVALEASNGSLAWTGPSRYLTGAVADESSVYTSEELGQHTLKAFSYDGVLRWSVDVAGTPTGASGGKVFIVNPSTVRDAQTGALTHSATNPAAWMPRQTLAAFGRVVSLDSNSQCPRWLSVTEPATSAAPFVWPTTHPAVGACLSEPLVTSRQSVLFATRDTATLFEVGLDGSERLACPLPLVPSGPGVLTRNRWVTSDADGRIEAFEVPPREAAQGWVTAGGGLHRANRPNR